jgi:hypothetical protein
LNKLLLLSLATAALAHEPVTTRLTWSQEISRIVYKHCYSCHREKGSAPMPLVTYEESRPWAKAIKEEVLSRSMPPWGAAKGFGDFRDDASLSQDEMNRLAEWVEGGAPQGDSQYLPTPPAVASLGKPPAGIRVRNLPGKNAVTLLGVRPLADAAEVRVTGLLPDGNIIPLIWLRKYKRDWNRTFIFRDPLQLPAGSVVKATSPLPLEWLIK